MEDQKVPSTYKARIALLESFREKLRRWSNTASVNERDELRSFLNRNLMAVRQAVIDAGTFRTMTMGPPPAIGGFVAQNIDPFTMIFVSWHGSSVVPQVVDMIEQAIGVYESLEKSDGLVRIRKQEAIDIEAAIERALRPAFRTDLPSSEREVQDAVETILNALGIAFVREKETAPVGPRAFHPDFTIPDLDLAIEIKLASSSHGASAIQEEIAADISAYQTKWRHLLFVIYDKGVITDPYPMRRDNLQHFGVSVIIVKH